MAINAFTIIRRSLNARRFSTATTVVTVAVAVGLMLVLLSMGESSRQAFRRGSGNMHLLVSNDTNRLVSVLNAIFYAGAPARTLSWEKFKEVEQLVRGRLPVQTNEFVIPIQQGDSYRGFPVTATTRDFFTRFSLDATYEPPMGDEEATLGWALQAGRIFASPFEVVLGADVAEQTGLTVGESIHLSHGRAEVGAHIHDDWSWEVVGILEQTGSAHDRAVFSTLESGWLIHAQDAVDQAEAGASRLTVDDLSAADRKLTGILVRVPTRPGKQTSPQMGPIAFELGSDATLMVAEPTAEITRLFRIVGNIDTILIGMAAIVMVSSGIAIMLALYNSMEQRRRQIAVLRVLGSSRLRIFALVLTESAMIGLIGALCGFVLAVLANFGVAAILESRLGLVVEPTFDGLVVFFVSAGTVLLAAVAGLVPATVAYRTPVARSLRPIV